MTYGNTTSEQTTYNSRLQPATYTLSNMNYQNTNICCTYPTYSTMTWTFGYYDDGSLKQAWDSTNEWFDRAYKYDQVGRLKEASTFRRARGLSPYPAVPYTDPYFQSITYDVFNHSSRTGTLYTGVPPSDNGTYVNNRRTDVGWEYDADGNNTRDDDYQQTFNAASALIHSVSHAKVGDGDQYPLEPRLDITQTYDGIGRPAKRDQISRMPGILDEFGNQSEPVEDTQTIYYLRSSVLGSATIVELGSANTVHIHAGGGKRIAREVLGSVSFEHSNPVTGSWVTSNGHSSYRTTGREERDPRGAELPLSNPYGSAQSYIDWKFSQPLFIEGGDPFDYSSGQTLDGLPVSEAEFQRRVANGSVETETLVFGEPGRTQGKNPPGRVTKPFPPPTFTWLRNPILEVISGSSYVAQFPRVRFFGDEEGSELGSDITDIQFHHQNTGRQMVPLGNLRKGLEELLKGDCGVFVQRLIDKANELYGGGQPHATSFWDAFSRIQDAGGYQLDDVASNGGTISGDLFIGELVNPSLPEGPYAGPGTVHLQPFGPIGRSARPGEVANAQARYVYKALHETLHLAKRGWYHDKDLARAGHAVDGTTAPKYKEDDHLSWSGNFDTVLQRHCAYPFK